MSKAKPMIFSGPMVRAILEGRKTQTRRVVTRKNATLGSGGWPEDGLSRAIPQKDKSKLMLPGAEETWHRLWPKWQPGDRLWVKETWQDGEFAQNEPRGPVYRATDPDWETACIGWKWKPSCFMPRWASRIMLEITGVRAERLQEISEEDAKAEGIEAVGGTYGRPFYRHYGAGCNPGYLTPCESFRSLWEKLHGMRGPKAWAANPWVWVVQFRPMEEAE